MGTTFSNEEEDTKFFFDDLFALEKIRTIQVNANEVIDEEKHDTCITHLLTSAWNDFNRTTVVSMKIQDFFLLLLQFYSELGDFIPRFWRENYSIYVERAIQNKRLSEADIQTKLNNWYTAVEKARRHFYGELTKVQTVERLTETTDAMLRAMDTTQPEGIIRLKVWQKHFWEVFEHSNLNIGTAWNTYGLREACIIALQTTSTTSTSLVPAALLKPLLRPEDFEFLTVVGVLIISLCLNNYNNVTFLFLLDLNNFCFI